jgi:hypothetical protein
MNNPSKLLLQIRPPKEPELGEKGIGHKPLTIRFRNKALQDCDAKRDHRLHLDMLELHGPILKNHFFSTWIWVALITKFSSVEL